MLLRKHQTQRQQPLQQQGHSRSRSRRGGLEHRAERGRSPNGSSSRSAGSGGSSGSRSSSRSRGGGRRDRSRQGAARAERSAAHTGSRDHSRPREPAGSPHARSAAHHARVRTGAPSPSAHHAKPHPARLRRPDRAGAAGAGASPHDPRPGAHSRSTRKPRTPSPGRLAAAPTAHAAAASPGRRTETSPVIRSLYRLSVQSAGLRPLCSALVRSDDDDGSLPSRAARGGADRANTANSYDDGSAASSDTDPWFWVHKERAAAGKRGPGAASSSSSSWWRWEQHGGDAGGAAAGEGGRGAEEGGAGAGREQEGFGEAVWPRRCRLWRAQSPTVSQQQGAVLRDGGRGQERPGEARKERSSNMTGTGGVWALHSGRDGF